MEKGKAPLTLVLWGTGQQVRVPLVATVCGTASVGDRLRVEGESWLRETLARREGV